MTHRPLVSTIDRCRLCLGGLLTPLIEMPSVPVSGVYWPVGEPAPARQQTSFPLSLVRCEACQHIQTGQALSNEVYEHYHFVGTHSESYMAHLRWVADWLIQTRSLRGKKVLEIGCSDGYLLERLQTQGSNQVFGYEPSGQLAKKCAERDVPVTTSFFPSNECRGRLFDTVVIRHVLEHIQDLRGVLQGIEEVLAPEGEVVIEVPSLEMILESNNFSNIFHEHVNYFSRHALAQFMGLAGLKPVFTKTVDIHGGSTLAVFSRNASRDESIAFPEIPRSACDSFVNRFEAYFASIRQLVQTAKRNSPRVYGYGAAERTSLILGLTGLTKHDIVKIFDKNQFLHGKYIPGPDIPIASPEHIRSETIGCIVIFATSHEAEILNDLAARYGYRGDVISLKGTPSLRSLLHTPAPVIPHTA